MAQWYRLSMMALILLVVWGCGKSPEPWRRLIRSNLRFTKADNGVITDSVTGLDWYVGPNLRQQLAPGQGLDGESHRGRGRLADAHHSGIESHLSKRGLPCQYGPVIPSQGGLGLVRADARQPDGLGLRLLQRPGELARHELRRRQTGVCGAFPKMMMGHSPEPPVCPRLT